MDNFVKTLIEEVKSQGVFDEFRFNCCLADVDTKPAYQNVRNRVENAVNDFLAKQHWTPDTNKVQLRERLRKHLLDSDVLDKGVDHIVDQVVNPKVATIFEPKIESIAYKYLGITPPPPPANPPPRPPILPAPPLPPYTPHGLGHMNGGSMLKVETTASLLPTDLEQISPDSDRATNKSDSKDDSKDDELPPGVDGDDLLDDDDTTSQPPCSIKEDTNNASLNASDSVKEAKEMANDSRDAGASQASQLSQVSSDSRLTIASTDVPQTTSANDSVELSSNLAANISEEAQMPKFSENSSDAQANSGRQLHFDIKQDAITFKGTERRNSLTGRTNGGSLTLSIEDAIMSEVKANINDTEDQPTETMAKASSELTKPERSLDSNFALFSQSEPVMSSENATPQLPALPEVPNAPEVVESIESPALDQVKADKVGEEPVPITLPNVFDDLNRNAEFTASPASASSSSKKSSHSKTKERRPRSHSRSDDKERRKSRDRERDKSRSKPSSSSKHSSHSSHSSSSKHRSSSSKYDKSSTTSSSRSSNHESSSSKRSSSRHESSSSHKKHKSSSSSSRSDRDRPRSRESRDSHSHVRSHNGSSSSSSNSKRDRERDRDRERNKSSSNSTSNSISAAAQDDHNEIKTKLHKRDSNDSNDDPPSSSSNNTDGQRQEKTTETTAQNGNEPPEDNGTNGTNCTNDTSNHDSAELVPASSVVVVSDILQQSTASFVELTAAVAPQSPAKETASEEKPGDIPLEPAETVPTSKSQDPVEELPKEVPSTSEDATVATVEETAPSPDEPKIVSGKDEDSPVEPPEPPLPAVIEEPANEATGIEESTSDHPEVNAEPAEVHETKVTAKAAEEGEPKVTSETTEEVEPKVTVEPDKVDESKVNAEEAEIIDDITHFEEDTQEFTARLHLIDELIKDRRELVNGFSDLGDASVPRRSLTKRRLSSDTCSSKEPISSSGSSCRGSSTSSADSPNAKAKRIRRDDVKTSPTPSEISVNSKENEELEKHEKGTLSGRRLSQKLCQQQRYTNDDLYKPRPLLSQRSRRRGLDSIL